MELGLFASKSVLTPHAVTQFPAVLLQLLKLIKLGVMTWECIRYAHALTSSLGVLDASIERAVGNFTNTKRHESVPERHMQGGDHVSAPPGQVHQSGQSILGHTEAH